MGSNSMNGDVVSECINDVLTDDMLRLIVGRVENKDDKKALGLVCKRWLRLQNEETKKLTIHEHVLPRMAQRFTRLVELDLSKLSYYDSCHRYVTDSDLVFIANAFPFLRILSVERCSDVTDVGIIAIAEGLPLLQSLNVGTSTRVTDHGLIAIAKGCRDLRILLAGSVSDAVGEALSENCPNLEELEVCINDDGLIKLASGCRQIRFLNIAYSDVVSDVGVSSFCRACSSSVKRLKLTQCRNIGDETILSLAKFCGSLETLDIISSIHGISDFAINSLATTCGSNLKSLAFAWNLNISDSTLSCILSQCRSLEALCVRHCEKLTDAAFQVIRNEEEPGLSLKILDVGGCNISDSTLSCILSKCRNLEALNVDACTELTDAAFQHIRNEEEPGLSLKVLIVICSPNITLAGIGFLVAKCPFLEYLDVSGCPHIKEAGLRQVDFHLIECCEIDFDSGYVEHVVFRNAFQVGVSKWMDWIIMDSDHNGSDYNDPFIRFDPLKNLVRKSDPFDKNPSNPSINNFFMDGYPSIH